LIITSCSDGVIDNQVASKNDTYLKSSPDPDAGCEPTSCEYLDGYCHITTNLAFDLSSCISPEPLGGCTVEVLPLMCSEVYDCDGVIEIRLEEFDSFDIKEGCLPENPEIDMDCVLDQIVYQFFPEIIDFWDSAAYLNNTPNTYSIYEKQLCTTYCTEWERGEPIRVRIVPCEESFACCITAITWDRNNNGNWTVASTVTTTNGDCYGPAPKCGKPGRLDGNESSGSLNYSCERQNCYQPKTY